MSSSQAPGAPFSTCLKLPTRPLLKIAALCRSSFPLCGRHLSPSSLNLAPPPAPTSTIFHSALTYFHSDPWLRWGPLSDSSHIGGMCKTGVLSKIGVEYSVFCQLIFARCKRPFKQLSLIRVEWFSTTSEQTAHVSCCWWWPVSMKCTTAAAARCNFLQQSWSSSAAWCCRTCRADILLT